MVLTEHGKGAFDAAMRLQTPWINKLSEGLRVVDIEMMQDVVTVLRRRLERKGDHTYG